MNKVKPNALGPGAVKVERRGRLQHVPTQFVPRVAFGENVFGEAFGTVTAIGVLNYLEHQFSHTSMIRHEFA